MGKVEEAILEFRKQKYSCSQATLLGIKRGLEADMPADAVLSAASVGLRGGIGRTMDEGTCGALTGAVIALGLLYPESPEKAVEMSKIIYNDFKETFGSVECGKITGENGKKLCNQCCLQAGCAVEKCFCGGI